MPCGGGQCPTPRARCRWVRPVARHAPRALTPPAGRHYWVLRRALAARNGTANNAPPAHPARGPPPPPPETAPGWRAGWTRGCCPREACQCERRESAQPFRLIPCAATGDELLLDPGCLAHRPPE